MEVPKRVTERKPVSERDCPEAILVRETTVEQSAGESRTHRAQLRTVHTLKTCCCVVLKQADNNGKVSEGRLPGRARTPYRLGDSLERDWGTLMAEGERASPPLFSYFSTGIGHGSSAWCSCAGSDQEPTIRRDTPGRPLGAKADF